MGMCWGSPVDNHTPQTTGNFSSVVSQTTSQTTSSTVSNFSKFSTFSAASGDVAFPNGQILPSPHLREYSLAELRAATKNFRAEALLGEGGFGKVYKGWLEEKGIGKKGNPMVIAVKKLKSDSVQGIEEWEVQLSSKVEDLIALTFWCLLEVVLG